MKEDIILCFENVDGKMQRGSKVKFVSDGVLREELWYRVEVRSGREVCEAGAGHL